MKTDEMVKRGEIAESNPRSIEAWTSGRREPQLGVVTLENLLPDVSNRLMDRLEALEQRLNGEGNGGNSLRLTQQDFSFSGATPEWRG